MAWSFFGLGSLFSGTRAPAPPPASGAPSSSANSPARGPTAGDVAAPVQAPSDTGGAVDGVAQASGAEGAEGKTQTIRKRNARLRALLAIVRYPCNAGIDWLNRSQTWTAVQDNALFRTIQQFLIADPALRFRLFLDPDQNPEVFADYERVRKATEGTKGDLMECLNGLAALPNGRAPWTGILEPGLVVEKVLERGGSVWCEGGWEKKGERTAGWYDVMQAMPGVLLEELLRAWEYGRIDHYLSITKGQTWSKQEIAELQGIVAGRRLRGHIPMTEWAEISAHFGREGPSAYNVMRRLDRKGEDDSESEGEAEKRVESSRAIAPSKSASFCASALPSASPSSSAINPLPPSTLQPSQTSQCNRPFTRSRANRAEDEELDQLESSDGEDAKEQEDDESASGGEEKQASTSQPVSSKAKGKRRAREESEDDSEDESPASSRSKRARYDEASGSKSWS
ncbi:hypothetical protein JCM10213_007117 [Rhodosporidiobolus nylandii]